MKWLLAIHQLCDIIAAYAARGNRGKYDKLKVQFISLNDYQSVILYHNIILRVHFVVVS